ncbi:MAG TPA: ATP-grasp domain-containing protein [Streptosporangiaceae bacterium]|nr:ATP-grasp domain-containing protein [Streptosporangiaceae bacterium]
MKGSAGDGGASVKKILMIGIHPGYAELFRHDNDLDLYVLEEKDIYIRDLAGYEAFGIRELRLGEYQQSDGFLDAAIAWHDEVGFDAVVPCWEYSVQAAGLLSERLGLKFPGMRAVDACTDKVRLRQAASEIGVAQPRFAPVRSVQDVAAFFDGRPIIVKPSNRRQSVGVVRIDEASEITAAWQECIDSEEDDGLANRPLQWRFIAEDYVEGYQVSVETLVSDGHVVFDNVSLLGTPTGGKYFPVMSVVVPAPIPQEHAAAVTEEAHRLLAGLDVGFGMFHSEWKIDDGRPQLIECAARVPGAFIPELVAKAYGFNLYGSLVRMLAGLDPLLIDHACGVAGIRHFTVPSGVLTEVRGIEKLGDLRDVFAYRIKMAPGERVPSFKDSWRRAGYVAAKCANAEQLEHTFRDIDDTVEFVVDPA